jgi:hypothetical protein
MEISGVSTSLITQTLASTATPSELQPLAKDESVPELRREDLRGLRGRRGLALGILKQELRAALKSFFGAQLAASGTAYESTRDADSPDAVADEVLGAAKQLVAAAPTSAAESLTSLQSAVLETTGYVRETVGAVTDDVDDIDIATAMIDEGLDELSNEVANYRESTAAVLAVDTSTRERSTIQIRTQEGDFVKLYLRRVDNMSATDISYSDGEMSFTSTEVALSSRSRTMLQVKGDLNEAETAAIQNVFAQAEVIADEFFGGDVGAAFNSMQSTQFDTEQLARVDLRFRRQEITSGTYVRVAAAVPESDDLAAPTVTAVEGSAAGAPEAAAALDVEAQPVTAAATAAQADAEKDSPIVDDAAASPSAFSAMADFLDTLSAFLRTVGEGFKAESSSVNFTYHYSESFKLNLLKAVMNTVAPDDAGNAVANAELVIDGVTEDA